MIFSIICFTSVIYTIFVIVVQSPFFFSYFKRADDNYPMNMNLYDASKAFDSELYFFKATGVIFLSYFMHIGAMPIQKGLKNNIARRSLKMFGIASLIECLMYLFVAVAGFFTMTSLKDHDLIFLRPNLVMDPDIFMMIAIFMTVVSVIISTAGNYIGLRYAIFSRFFGTEEITTGRNVIITMIVYAITTTVGIVKSEVLEYLGFAGGYFGIVVMYIIPSLLFIVSVPEKAKEVKNVLVLVSFGLLSVCGIIGATKSFLNLVL